MCIIIALHGAEYYILGIQLRSVKFFIELCEEVYLIVFDGCVFNLLVLFCFKKRKTIIIQSFLPPHPPPLLKFPDD